MDPSYIYALAAGGTFLLIFLKYSPYIVRLTKYKWVLKHLSYTYLVGRHRFVGPWSRAGVLIQLFYVSINIFCLLFRASKVSDAGLRAGKLSLINMIPLLSGPHHGFMADFLGISLTTYRAIHRSGGLMTIVLASCHILISLIAGKGLSTRMHQRIFEIIASHPVIVTTVVTHGRRAAFV